MAANSPEIERLLKEFGAQDHSVEMVVVQGEKRIRAATYSEGNQRWEPTPAGLELLNPPEPVAEDTLPPAKPKNLKGLSQKPPQSP